jgi:hypothetical protein
MAPDMGSRLPSAKADRRATSDSSPIEVIATPLVIWGEVE